MRMASTLLIDLCFSIGLPVCGTLDDTPIYFKLEMFSLQQSMNTQAVLNAWAGRSSRGVHDAQGFKSGPRVIRSVRPKPFLSSHQRNPEPESANRRMRHYRLHSPPKITQSRTRRLVRFPG
jgi:hypothetical protein